MRSDTYSREVRLYEVPDLAFRLGVHSFSIYHRLATGDNISLEPASATSDNNKALFISISPFSTCMTSPRVRHIQL